MDGILDVRAELERLDAPWEAVRPALIAIKRERMATGAVPFFRATAPLFFFRLREELAPPRPAPLEQLGRWLEGDASAAQDRLSWCAGDVHLENFGAYRANDGEERFGLNDFDDALVAPLEVDVLRLLASCLVAARSRGGLTGAETGALARRTFEVYARGLGSSPRPDPGAEEVEKGPVRDLLLGATEKSREDFLDKRAPIGKSGKRAFVSSDRYRLLEGPERANVLEAFSKALTTLGERADPQPGFYKVLDVAARTAGLGSLGVGRYAVLVEGKAAHVAQRETTVIKADEKHKPSGSHGNVLLELKEAKPASLARRAVPSSRTFADEAERVMDGQTALRGEAAHHLGRTTLAGTPYYLRRLSHREDRIDLESMGAQASVLASIVDAEARALASAHLRSRQRLGLGPLAVPGAPEREAWLLLAARLAGKVEADYLSFTFPSS
ncbi:DUF2252 family protein [bacterium]|nr:DUF2252 family protein [bacterium]